MQIDTQPAVESLEEVLFQADIATPALIYDADALQSRAGYLSHLAANAGAKLLYPMKANSFAGVLETLAPAIDGFAASSAFEARLIKKIAAARHSIHFTSPGIRAEEFDAINGACDYISFNSLSQRDQFAARAAADLHCGLRVNPELSLAADERYDPCRKNSKLGIPISALEAYDDAPPAWDETLSGVHFHTNCEAREFSGLRETAELLAARIPGRLARARWINIGGGYLFLREDEPADFEAAAALFRDRFRLEVFMEPGSAFLSDACYLASTVVDVFASGDKQVAVLDTATSHWQDVFEYEDFTPTVLGAAPAGRHEYILAGATCLAGDLFGTYRFNRPLAVGARVVFADAGAYSFVRAHYFNGLNLPAVYACARDGDGAYGLAPKKIPEYEDFARYSGAVEVPRAGAPPALGEIRAPDAAVPLRRPGGDSVMIPARAAPSASLPRGTA